MDKRQLHHILQELSSRLECPNCKTKILVTNLELIEKINNVCRFQAKCSKCQNTAHISAIVETKMSSEAKKVNASTRIHKDAPLKADISNSEIEYVQDFFKVTRKINELF